jgi:hypothetical protein
MEKVYDIHVHYTYDIPMPETIEIFREEFLKTGTEKFCFLSVPHHDNGEHVSFDEMQNIKGLYLKKVFGNNAYAFAHLEHPLTHDDTEKCATDFLNQAKEFLSVGYDGFKMLEGYPSIVKAWNLHVDSPVYDKFYSYMEECGYPIVMHIANPEENWDIDKVPEYARSVGRFYDETYPTKDALTASVLNVMKKHPRLKLLLAHMGFFSYNINEALEFMSYPNTMLDVTPGGEQLINMKASWDVWLPFFEKYQNRIFYGTDFYAFPKSDNWEVAFSLRPTFVHRFFETDTEHEYLGEHFTGVKIDKSIRDKIYRDNFTALLKERKSIDEDYLKSKLISLSSVKNKLSPYADSDIKFMLENL